MPSSKCWWTFDIPAVKEEPSSGIVAICLPFKAAPLAAGRFLNAPFCSPWSI